MRENRASVRQSGAGRRFRIAAFFAALTLVGGAYGCGGGSDELILATTTSTQDSGLLDVLIPQFEDENDYKVKTIAVGSGEALRLASEGEADVVLAHSPKAEEEFMAAGNGEDRLVVMHNDFVIVGPDDDPAGVKDAATAAEALEKIASSESIFMSRGDESGTHTKELSLWTAARNRAERLVVPGDRPGHGRDTHRGQREAGLHPERSGDIPRAEGKPRPGVAL